METIDSERLVEIAKTCLFDDEETEDRSTAVFADGITRKFGFHPARLEESKKEIGEMLDMLPSSFRKDGGGGMSFLSACEDKNGEQWTGLQQYVELLFVLGIAIGRVKLLMPRGCGKHCLAACPTM